MPRLGFITAIACVTLLPTCNKPPPTPSASDREIAELRKQVADLQAALRASPTPQPPAADDSVVAAKAIYRELLKLQSATQTGLNYPQYCERLLDAKSEIEATLPRVQNVRFQRSAENVLSIYIDARELWSNFARESYHKLSFLEKSQFEKYQLDLMDGYVVSSHVPVIWNYASAIVDKMPELFPNLLQ